MSSSRTARPSLRPTSRPTGSTAQRPTTEFPGRREQHPHLHQGLGRSEDRGRYRGRGPQRGRRSCAGDGEIYRHVAAWPLYMAARRGLTIPEGGPIIGPRSRQGVAGAGPRRCAFYENSDRIRGRRRVGPRGLLVFHRRGSQDRRGRAFGRLRRGGHVSDAGVGAGGGADAGAEDRQPRSRTSRAGSPANGSPS